MINIVKRNGRSIEPFSLDKIVSAVTKAQSRVSNENPNLPLEIATSVEAELLEDNITELSVNDIHTMVENALMDSREHDVAREYITYRKDHMPDIFKPRQSILPYEYPDATAYVEAIRQSHWIHCVGAEDRVVTSEGIKTVKQLHAETGSHTNQSFNGDTSVLTLFDGETPTSASPMLHTGVRDLYTLTTVEGYSHTVTADHRVMTDSGWKQAQDLVPGESLLLQSAKGLFGSNHKPEKAFLAGHFQGDGSTTNGSLVWCVWNHEYSHIPELEQALKTVYGQEVHTENKLPEFGVENSTTNPEVKVRKMYSKHLASHFTKNQIPEFVWQGTEETVANYLRGLFLADGTVYVTRKSAVAKLTQVSKSFMEDIQILLLNLGVRSQMYRREGGPREMPGGTYICQDSYTLEITRRDHVHLLNSYTKIFDYRGVTIPSIKNSSMVRTSDYARFKSLDFKRKDSVYCVSVTNSDMKWVCNGFITHNTEYDYDQDVRDYKNPSLPAHYKTVYARSLLAISQIEVAVKSYWKSIDEVFPKHEFAMLAATFDESEARHFDTYRNLLELVDLNEMFNHIDESSVLKARSDSLRASIKVEGQSRRDILLKNIMFSSFIENVSLYSQFLILKSFAEIESLFKGTANGVDATS